MILDYAHFLKYNTRSINNQRKIDKLDYPKQKLVCVKMQPGEWEKKYLQIIYLMRVKHPVYIKNS